MIVTEQKARTTYDNILRLVDDPDVRDPIKYLREREIVHYQRFAERVQSRWNGSEARNVHINQFFCLFKRFSLFGEENRYFPFYLSIGTFPVLKQIHSIHID